MSDQLERPERPARRPRPAPDAAVDPIDYRSPASEQTPPPAASQPRAVTEAPPTSQPQTPEAPTNTGAPQAALPTAATPPTIGAREREQTVQLNSRVSVGVGNIFDAASGAFPSKRAAMEYAITLAFGS